MRKALQLSSTNQEESLLFLVPEYGLSAEAYSQCNFLNADRLTTFMVTNGQAHELGERGVNFPELEPASLSISISSSASTRRPFYRCYQ